MGKEVTAEEANENTDQKINENRHNDVNEENASQGNGGMLKIFNNVDTK